MDPKSQSISPNKSNLANKCNKAIGKVGGFGKKTIQGSKKSSAFAEPANKFDSGRPGGDGDRLPSYYAKNTNYMPRKSAKAAGGPQGPRQGPRQGQAISMTGLKNLTQLRANSKNKSIKVL
jgi:hypothetical protein